MERSNTKQLVKYSPISPSVLFHRIRIGMTGKWDQSKMLRSVRRWLRPSKQSAPTKSREASSQKHASLIIPDTKDPFMLMAKNDPMSSLLAENQRLRNLINDLVREDRRSSEQQQYDTSIREYLTRSIGC